MALFQDLADLPEDERIDVIAHYVLQHGKTVAILVDADPPDKVERYIAKLRERHPKVVVLARAAGPIPGVVQVKVGPRPPTVA